ncbi:MAG: arginine N-succinyltransferase [Bdellovibrio sp.]|nr:MAG: arginine N-succinyltransferase [Bdellovibrio sp.]
MSFLIRSVREDDLEDLLVLAKQFSLLSLPADRKVLEEKINKSLQSFRRSSFHERSEFLFVLEDQDFKKVVGCSQIKAKKGTPEEPNFSFQVLKKERFSKALGIGFIHQVLRLKANTDGPSELGGLVVDKSYRGRPEKLGKLISLCRFHFIGMKPELFENQFLAEMAPPLTDEGRSEFWEALGRRFTGMPYVEADRLSQMNKEFIQSLFPEEDIYLCLLDAKARLVIGRVGEETRPALHLLESVGLRYNDEVDPFDGGPHISAPREELKILKESAFKKVKEGKGPFSHRAIVGYLHEGQYQAIGTAYRDEGEDLILPERTLMALQINPGDTIYFMPIDQF